MILFKHYENYLQYYRLQPSQSHLIKLSDKTEHIKLLRIKYLIFKDDSQLFSTKQSIFFLIFSTSTYSTLLMNCFYLKFNLKCQEFNIQLLNIFIQFRKIKQLIYHVFDQCFLFLKFVYNNQEMKFAPRYLFSSIKHFDLITIGPYANRVAKAVAKATLGLHSILTVEEQNHIIEPSLLFGGNPVLPINQQNYQFSQIQRGVGVHCIDPEKSQIVLKNGSSYKYKHLVYSGYPTDWKQSKPTNMKYKKYQANSTFIHNDYDFSGLEQIFSRRGGSIVITVPKEAHFGSQIYFMMLLKSRMKARRRNAPFQTDPIKITVVCEGSSLVSYNKAFNSLLQEYLDKSNINLIKNSSHTINPSNRTISLLKHSKTLSFCSMFQYLPLSIPKVLSKSGIDPFQTNRHTLNHTRYSNVYILGNVVNNVYSFSAMESMSKIIACNLIYSFQRINKRALYHGQSRIGLWVNDQECHVIETDYDGGRLNRDYGSSWISRSFAAWNRKKYMRKYVQKSINQGAASFGLLDKKPETISIQRHHVPMVIAV